jgi:flagellar motor component MotA
VVQRLRVGVLLFVAFVMLVMGILAGGTLAAFVDAPSLIIVLGISVPLVYVRGFSWKRLRRLLVSAGAIGTMTGLIHMLQNLDDPAQLGPGIATAFITLYYALVAAAFCRAMEEE